MPSNQDVACSFFNVGACVQFFTTIRKLGNKFGNVSRLRVWAPNEPKPGCSRLVLLCAASHASANQWANKLEMHRRVQIHTCLLSPVPLLSIIQGLWTWQGGKIPERRGCGCSGQESVCHYYIHSHLVLPSGLLTLLLLQAALLIMFVPVEFHKCCPPCPMVKKTQDFWISRGSWRWSND